MLPHTIVIDTQSLFDWLLFDNPTCRDWPGALSSEEWKWIFTSDMRAEFDFVLAKGLGERWKARPDAIERAWTTLAHELPAPEPAGAAMRLHCSDPDDQKFIDLAIAAGAHTLVTRDKALLKLAGRAHERHGVRICRPQSWSEDLAIRARHQASAMDEPRGQ